MVGDVVLLGFRRATAVKIRGAERNEAFVEGGELEVEGRSLEKWLLR
jgi:hypothetical protein